MSTNIGTIFAALGDVIKMEEEAAALPDLANLFTKVSGNPTAANFLVQGQLFIAELAASQPGIAQGLFAEVAPVLAASAQSVQAELATAQAKLAAALAGTTAPTVEPASSAGPVVAK